MKDFKEEKRENAAILSQSMQSVCKIPSVREQMTSMIGNVLCFSN